MDDHFRSAIRRAREKRDLLRKRGMEPRMEQVANALRADKDWCAAERYVIEEAFRAQ